MGRRIVVGYILASAVGVFAGGVVMALAIRAVPRVVAGVMQGVMQGMMGGMMKQMNKCGVETPDI